MSFNGHRRTGKESNVGIEGYEEQPLLPEWGDSEVDDATWIAALEASRRQQFAELAEL